MIISEFISSYIFCFYAVYTNKNVVENDIKMKPQVDEIVTRQTFLLPRYPNKSIKFKVKASPSILSLGTK